MAAKNARTEYRVRNAEANALESALNTLAEEGYQITHIFQDLKPGASGFQIVACREVDQSPSISFRRG